MSEVLVAIGAFALIYFAILTKLMLICAIFLTGILMFVIIAAMLLGITYEEDEEEEE